MYEKEDYLTDDLNTHIYIYTYIYIYININLCIYIYISIKIFESSINKVNYRTSYLTMLRNMSGGYELG